MSNTSLIGKLEGDTEIKSTAEQFHDVFSCRPHHISNITTEKVHGCKLHEGEFGISGSIITWHYTHDGKQKLAKQVIEEIDDVNNSTTFQQFEGDLMEEYKTFKIIVKATPKEGSTPKEGPSVVRWIVEYEKLNEDVPAPHTLMEYFSHVTKDIDDHLQEHVGLTGKLELDIHIKSTAEQFHEVFRCRPHHISNITPEKVHGCELHEGEFGISGSIITWSYTHDGKQKLAKQVIEEIDDVNNSTTFQQFEGDLMEEYKTFKIIVKATPKEGSTPKEGPSVVRWIVEFEKLNEDVPAPHSLMEYFSHVTKDIDGHLQEQVQA